MGVLLIVLLISTGYFIIWKHQRRLTTSKSIIKVSENQRYGNHCLRVVLNDEDNSPDCFIENMAQKFEIEKELYKALQNNELTIYYQPIVDVHKNMIAVEALLRWDHPKKGMIPPSLFIPIAEKSVLIVLIGEWVLRKVCSQAKAWQEEGYDRFKICVNISAVQFYSNLVPYINQLLAEYEISPEKLELEITETYKIDNIDQFIEIIHELKSIGLHISLDDFGTGYSSLSYLPYIPATRLKIDQSFIRNLHHDDRQKNFTIIKSIIDLAHQLEIEVVAEGVEKEGQYLTLRENGCDQFQGYFFSKPISASEVEEVFFRK